MVEYHRTNNLGDYVSRGTPQGLELSAEAKTLFESDSAQAFRMYLELMEDSEPPRAYLIWTLLSAASCLIGKNSKLWAGPLHSTQANLFVVLLGPAGVRKTTSIRMIESLLGDTSINFGPTDTGGQRHGMMSALMGLQRRDAGGRITNINESPTVWSLLKPRPLNDLTFFAPELGRLLGQGGREMADFLVDLYDGARIEYETKAGSLEIKEPLANLLGATTPSSLATMIPDNAGTHGVLTRILFIYEEKPYKRVPIPPTPSEIWYEQRQDLIDRFLWIDDNRINFSMDSGASAYFEHMYGYVPKLTDARLENYRERRATMLQKIGMAIAALRTDCRIIREDLMLGHELLCMMEPKMHRALEYFGKNKVYVGRMLIIEYLRNQPSHMAEKEELIMAAASDLKRTEAEEAISSMLASGILVDFGVKIILGEAKNDLSIARAKKAAIKKDQLGA